MMNKYICTWFCEDQKGDESYFPQTGQNSSSPSHQLIYWRCIVTFYITSVKFNQQSKHLFFTNAGSIPVVDGVNVAGLLSQLGVQIIKTDFKYKTPKGFYKSWQNQFYEFSILEHITTHFNDDDLFLILDSDCLFIKPADQVFEKARAEGGFLSYEINYPAEYDINGINRLDMMMIYADLLNENMIEIPTYHAGEFLLCSTSIIKALVKDFKYYWPLLLQRHKKGQKKFNEEAHTLSFLYYKNNLKPGGANHFIKRVWTNPVIYRNVDKSDDGLVIWHLPAEKDYRIPRLFQHLLFKRKNFGLDLTNEEFQKLIKKTIAIPKSSFFNVVNYYIHTYKKAIKKRIF